MLQREREILNGTLNQSQVQSVSPAVANKKEIADMIPEFNPSKLSSLSSNQWVRKTESIGSAYSLDGTTLALHAAMKLRGAARLWHDGAPDCATTWDRFKCAFLEAFPTSTNEADVHAELMRRKKRKEETYEEYFYEMVAIAKKVEISDQAVVRYIIGGLNQTDMMRSLSLQLHDSPIELLRRIKNYEDTMVQEPCRSNQRLDKTANHREAGHTGYMGKKRCYNCNELGHISTQLPKPQKNKKVLLL